jgi:pimeloyl-ACP methyl ester carboxylesterase
MPINHVQANGLRFACVEEGTGPLVLLLHGFPDTPQTWDHARPALARAGFRAVSPFMRGYLPSEIPTEEAYDSDTLGRDVLALIEALGERDAIVVGHDWGASAAFSAVGLDPSKVRLLVTIGIPHPASLRPTPRLMWKARHFLSLRRRGAAARIRATDFAYIDELVQRWSPAWKVPADETVAVKAAFREPGCLEAALGYYRALRASPTPGQRRRVEVPAVAFAGEHDTISTRLYEKARTRYTSSYEVVTMPGGHFMHREHPGHFVDELLHVVAAAR